MRAGCAFVAERAQLVHIDDEALSALARGLSGIDVGDESERFSVEYAVTVGAVNFGSGWHPFLNKEPDASGSVTIMRRLQRRFESEGPFSAQELVPLTPEDCASVFGQTMAPPVDELMGLFARSLNELGVFLLERFDGSFDALIAAARGSAVGLVELLQEMPMYRDVASYDGRTVPFLKRAQLTASDIGGAAGSNHFSDLDRLTVFADNLVPHVLRVEGVLELDADLASTIDAGRLLEPGGPGEVELRACAVEAGERMAAELDGSLTCRQIDNRLWRWGQEARFKAAPRPRVRTYFY